MAKDIRNTKLYNESIYRHAPACKTEYISLYGRQ